VSEYPNPCTKCGFCCLVETCPIGIDYHKLSDKYQPCPSLGFDENGIGECALYASLRDQILYPGKSFTHHNEKLTITESMQTNLSLLDKTFGIGAGCCIKARAIQGGVEYDFASLPSAIKQSIALIKRT
jgi:hypothetical protein